MPVRPGTLSIPLLVLLALACVTGSRAEESAAAGDPPAGNIVASDAAKPDAPAPPDAATVKPGTPGAYRPPARTHRQPAGRTPGQVMDESVRRLTHALDLDAGQQAKLRQILLDQQRQAQRLRSDGVPPGADRVALTLAIAHRTREQIRAMLNEEQRKKYSTDVPPGTTTVGNADLEHWMHVLESKRAQGGEGAK